MQMDDLARPRALVQVVDVLGDDADVMAGIGKCGKSAMAGIRLALHDLRGAPAVPAPEQRRITPETRFAGEFGWIKPRPQAGEGIAEGGDPAFGGHAGAGEHGDAKWALHRLHVARRRASPQAGAAHRLGARLPAPQVTAA